ncbi:MAG: anaerobic ribonucleoside-triphosphate reductase activating protein [Oscillospiraceae bacterium]|nr:anaerobic ribonucleoside-triphosphate reductase activating protein [Oscillospiraceae bacterium]
MSDTLLRIADTIQDSIVDGPGFRFVVFTQGCLRHCPECHNPHTWDPAGGKEVTVDSLYKTLSANPLTDGLTLSGGEPYLQAAACAELAQKAKNGGFNVWCYSGYTFEEILEISKTDPGFKALIEATDVLIDGMFLIEEKSLTLKWRGSHNQRVIDVKKSLESGEVVLHANR